MTDAPIPPDIKDWTWVVDRVCPECGYDASQIPAVALRGELVRLTVPWPEVLRRPDVRSRPVPTTWSALEYACHVQEVLDVFAERFALILEQDHATMESWDQDAAATAGAYADQDPVQVAHQIPGRVEALSAVLARFDDPTTWTRGAVRSDGADFTALGLARYLLHDLAHHLHDVGADRG